MSKLSLPDIGSLANSASARQSINDNFTAIEEAIENTLSRDGATPNQMEADLDLNSNSVINVADPVADMDAVNKRSVGPLVVDAVGDLLASLGEASFVREIEFAVSAGDTSVDLADYLPFVAIHALFYNGIFQNPSSYSLGGSTVTFTETLPEAGKVVVVVSNTTSIINNSDNLSNTVALSGGVTRSIRDKLSDTISVKDFGAVGDGVTDDRAAIQAALDASLIVFFPDGDYRITGALTVRDFQVLHGGAAYGQGSTAQAQGGARLVFDGVATACISQADTTTSLLHFGMENLTIRATGTYSWMLDFLTVSGIKLHHLRLETTSTTTGGMRTTKLVSTDSSWVCHFVDVSIRLPTGGTARTVDTDTGDSCWIGGALGGGTGAILRGTGGWKFIGVRIDNATGYGVTISVETESLSQHQFVGCQVEQHTLGGFLIDGDADDTLAETDVNFVISGCQLRNPSATDIVFQNATGPVLRGGAITGCIFTSPSSTRISRDASRWQHVTVAGNTHNGATVAQNNYVGGQFLASPLTLAQSAVAVSHTGSVAETVLATIAVPANAMGVNGRLRVTTLWTVTNNANNKNLRVAFGGTNYTSIPVTTQASARYVTEVANRNAANSQVGAPANFIGIGQSTGAVVTSAIDTTAAQNIEIKTQLANAADTVTLESYVIELIRGE